MMIVLASKFDKLLVKIILAIIASDKHKEL